MKIKSSLDLNDYKSLSKIGVHNLYQILLRPSKANLSLSDSIINFKKMKLFAMAALVAAVSAGGHDITAMPEPW